MADIHGVYDERFEAVRTAFARNLDSGEELGASFLLDIDGDIVIDMWGGFRDEAKTIPWDERVMSVWPEAARWTASACCARTPSK